MLLIGVRTIKISLKNFFFFIVITIVIVIITIVVVVIIIIIKSGNFLSCFS